MPFVIEGAVAPLDDAIDIVTGVALTALLGFHWAFLPTFIAKLVPFVDMIPSWTLAVFITTRGHGSGRRESVGKGMTSLPDRVEP